MKNLVYITGFDRSGSTLVMNYLSNAYGMIAVGETKHLFNDGMNFNSTLCSCGELLKNCPIWSRIENELIVNNIEKNNIFFKKYLRNSSVLNFLFNKRFLERFSSNNTLKDIENVFFSLNHDNIIDSSKTITYGHVLSKFPKDNFINILVIRNPIGVFNSMKKKMKKSEIINEKSYMFQTKNYFFVSIRWILINSLAILLNCFKKNFFIIKYEDFILNPKKQLKKVGIILNKESNLGDEFHMIREFDHSISGNPSRMTKRIKFQLDNEWVKKIPFYQRAIIYLICFPLMIKFKYSWKK